MRYTINEVVDRLGLERHETSAVAAFSGRDGLIVSGKPQAVLSDAEVEEIVEAWEAAAAVPGPDAA